ncbi:ECF transporter S component [Amnibacterium flavum]|uniref:ECF transporter S component n=1 Tax=Amnibacterium flavum TaxID=2173173 RepID=UPI0014020047|nr:ECF transporter S component [Amnibacterium flavum]
MSRFPTRYLLTCAAIGAAGGVLLIPANNVAAAVSASLPPLYAAIVGVWILPVITGLALLRRPGVGVLVALLASLVTVPFTPYGARSIITGLMVGIALELPFAIALYRHWRPWLFFVAALLVGGLYAGVSFNSLDLPTFPAGVQIAFVALLLVSVAVAVALGLWLARAVERTGVVRGIARPRAATPGAEAVR